jgi:hypothetical protein
VINIDVNFEWSSNKEAKDLKILDYESVNIFVMFLFALEQLKNKLVEKNINNHLSTNNSKELSNSLKQTLPKASRQFIE